jgi:hypothetical protein
MKVNRLNKKFLLIGLVVALTMSSTTSYAATKAGSPCNKAGVKSVSAGKTYTCVKSGKKLVWNVGVLVPVAKPAPATSPSAATVATKEEPKLSFIETLRAPAIDGRFRIESITFPIPAKLPSSWDDLYENREGIAFKAWKSIAELGGTQSNLPLSFNLTVGPSTSLVFTDIESTVSIVSNKFKAVSQPKTISVLAFNYDDRDWAVGRLRELVAGESDWYRKIQEEYIMNMCSATTKACWSAMGYTTPSGKGVILLGVVDKEKLKTLDPTFSNYLRFEKGLTVAHEYFHVIQLNILGKNWFQMMFAPPSWFNEASAVFVENGVMNRDSFNRYMQFRAVDSKLAYPSCGSSDRGCISVTEETLTKFLSLSNYSNNWNDFPYGMKYEVSNRVIEALVAVKGYESIVDIYKYQAQDHTFEEAFNHVYGISYSQAVPILVKIVADQFANDR